MSICTNERKRSSRRTSVTGLMLAPSVSEPKAEEGSKQWRRQPKNLGGAKLFDFRRITLLCLVKHLSKHKMTRNLGGMAPLATTMVQRYHEEISLRPIYRKNKEIVY